MNTKKVIRQVLFTTLWICIGGGMMTLLIAAISKENKELCADYNITIKGSQEILFVDKNDISLLLTNAVGTDIKGRKITEINLKQLEQLLENNIWISDAELWFDNRDELQVLVTEREPIARIFTTANNSFYLDSNEIKMPLSEKLSAKVPVFTNFSERKLMTAKDSILLTDVRNTAMFIMNDPFWMSQVSQIDINEEGYFEMIPVLGNHLVKLGDGTDIDKKFNRLMLLYKQVLNKSGFDIYSTIDVAYAGQVIGIKRGAEKNIVDSAKLRTNVENLLKQTASAQNDSTDIIKPNVENQSEKIDSLKIVPAASAFSNTGNSKPIQNETENKQIEKKPKALMPKKN